MCLDDAQHIACCIFCIDVAKIPIVCLRSQLANHERTRPCATDALVSIIGKSEVKSFGCWGPRRAFSLGLEKRYNRSRALDACAGKSLNFQLQLHLNARTSGVKPDKIKLWA